ncbi:MAG: MATE family efflux transporter [Pseudomonadota bacterium]
MARSANQNDISYGAIFKLAWPASVASSVTPLLGVVDVWALGQSSRPLDIAAVGLGAVIFSLAYWTFGFVRMSVAGLTAQAVGAQDETEARAALARGGAICGGIGLALIILQAPIGALAFIALSTESEASAQTLANARAYFDIRIWGAPFALGAYAVFGWLTARGRTDYLMIASVFMTGLNIVLDYIFVVMFDWGAPGVAAGTLIAEIAGFFVALAFVGRVMASHGGLRSHWALNGFWRLEPWRRTLAVNLDIFIRTLLLAFSFSWFIQRGGAFGDVTLAANQLLIQLFLITGLALDGTAIAAETLVGQALGAKDKTRGAARFQQAVRKTFILAGLGALAFVSVYGLAGDFLISLLTPEGPIAAASRTFMPWVIISPLIVVIGFQLDGIFVGATLSREMRNSMIISAPLFIALSIVLAERYGNHGLWAAFSVYFVARAITLGAYMPRLRRRFGL